MCREHHMDAKAMVKEPWSTMCKQLRALMCLVFCCGLLAVHHPAHGTGDNAGFQSQARFSAYLDHVYSSCGLQDKLDKEVFDYAMIGYFNLKQQDSLKKPDILSIVDYTQPSTRKRFFVLDLSRQKLLFNSLVAHGKNTGDKYARAFSNRPESKQSSLGFIVTGETYYGKHGLSLRLKGAEDDFNSNCLQRYIVVHGADYASEDFIEQYGRLGRSWGCPALPREVSRQVIQKIQDGTCFFSFYRDEDYLQSSELLDRGCALDAFSGAKPQGRTERRTGS